MTNENSPRVSPMDGADPAVGADAALTGTAAYDAGVGEMPSWAELVAAHADSVYGLAYRLTGNKHDAEDLTQETFMSVFRSLKSYRPGTFEGWLHRITTNLFLDMVRHRQVIRMEALPENYDRVPGTLKTPEQAVDDATLDPDLEVALAELQPDYRAVVVLCDVVGLTYEEIASTLGIKMGTVRSRIHRARSSLRASLERLERERQNTAEVVHTA